MDRKSLTLRDAEEGDSGVILRLNRRFEELLSPLNEHQLNLLEQKSCYFRVAVQDERVVGFLLAIGSEADYVNENYAWFTARYPQFVYVDRIAIDDEIQGAGIGSALYGDSESWVKESGGCTWLTDEVNIQPPNTASLKFHQRQGFVEVGRQQLKTRKKTVALLAKQLS